jgi:hypothetical protein
MIYSSVYRFFTSNLRARGETLDRHATQKRGTSAERRVVLGDEPVVDLVLAHHRITALVLDDVVGHQEVAQEAQRLFLLLLQRLGDLLPLILELSELGLLDLREQQVLEQVHRVQTDAALVGGFENLQRATDVGGDLDEHHVVGQIAPLLLQLGRVVVVVL